MWVLTQVPPENNKEQIRKELNMSITNQIIDIKLANNTQNILIQY